MIPTRWSAVAFVVSLIAVGAAADTPAAFAPSAVDLPAWPIRTERAAVTVDVSSVAEALSILGDAYAANDLPRFEAALTSAKSFCDAMPIGDERNAFRRAILVYEDVHLVWSYAATDPAGSFFNDDSLPGVRDRLRAYDGFESFIDQYRVSDRRGDVFYPSAETRAFLLRQLQTPAVSVAERRSVVRRSVPPPAPQVATNEVAAEAAPAAAEEAVAESPAVVSAVAPATSVASRAEGEGAGTPASAATVVAVDALASDMDNAAEPPVAPLHAELIDPETAQPLVFVVLALVAGVLTLALRAPEEEAQGSAPAVPELVITDVIEDDEPLIVRRRA